MTDAEIQELDGQPVMVLTSEQVPVSLGRIRVSNAIKKASGPRIEVEFETPTLGCRIGIPVARLPLLKESFNGEQFTYRLSRGDSRSPWPSPHSLAEIMSLPADGVPSIETYPLPEKSRLQGLAAGESRGRHRD